MDIHKIVEAAMKVTEDDMVNASNPEVDVEAPEVGIEEPVGAERPEVTPELIDSLIAEIPELAECDKEALLRGVTVEMEHFDVVGGDVSIVARLACGHIQEFPGQDYYAALEEMEQGLRDVPAEEDGGEEVLIDGEEDVVDDGGQFEGRTVRGKRDGTGPFKDSRQRRVSNVGRRQAAGEKCPIVPKKVKKKVKKKVVKEDIDAGAEVVKINSAEDFQEHGAGAAWCPAREDGEKFFKMYAGGGHTFYIVKQGNEPLYAVQVSPDGKRQVWDKEDNSVSLAEVPAIMADLGVHWEYKDGGSEEPVETDVTETKKEDAEASDKAAAKKELKSILRKIHKAVTVDAVEDALDRLAKHGVLKDTDASRLSLVKDEAARKIKKLEAGNKEETPESKTDEVVESVLE